MVEYYAYLFLGEDDKERKNRIDSIKAVYLDNGLKDIDSEVVYSDNKQLSPPKFSEFLSYLPSSPSKKRIVHIKNIESLSEDNRVILIKYLKNPSKSVLLLLDSYKPNIDDAFIKKLEPFVKIFNFRSKKKLGVFDLTDGIAQGKITDVLVVLNTLINSREKPENILGALRWKWEDMKENLSVEKFKQGLKLLLDTDIKIKNGRLNKELALEYLVIRLSYLL